MNTLEIAPVETVLQAAHDFAAALGETAQYQAFLKASDQIQTDERVRAAVQAFQKRQQELMGETLRSLTEAEQRELDQLRENYYNLSSVSQYNEAQAAFKDLCQTAGDVLSDTIGFDFAAACRKSSCCG